jgi:hypothetical protein
MTAEADGAPMTLNPAAPAAAPKNVRRDDSNFIDLFLQFKESILYRVVLVWGTRAGLAPECAVRYESRRALARKWTFICI